jgi:hypothetical protein
MGEPIKDVFEAKGVVVYERNVTSCIRPYTSTSWIGFTKTVVLTQLKRKKAR